MPYIQAKLTVSMAEEQKIKIQKDILNVIAELTGKPKSFIMTNIEDKQEIWMSDKKIDKGAYISVSLLGNISKQACGNITRKICQILKTVLDIDGQFVYISYHPVDLWGWNSQMF